MPLIILCENYPYCDNPVAKQGDLCEVCKQRAEKQKANRWMYAGFPKSVDNSRKHTQKVTR